MIEAAGGRLMLLLARVPEASSEGAFRCAGVETFAQRAGPKRINGRRVQINLRCEIVVLLDADLWLRAGLDRRSASL
jgi:hypothetical protein